MRLVGDLTYYRDVYGILFSPIKGKMWRGLLSILSGVLFIGLSGVLSDSVGAVSDYDHIYKTTNQLLIDTNTPPQTTVDISTRWLQMLNGNNGAVSEFSNYPRYTTNTSGSTVFCNPDTTPCGINATVLDDLLNLDENDSLMISQGTNMASTSWFGNYRYICYAKNKQLNVTWDLGGVGQATISNEDRCLTIDPNTVNNRYLIRYDIGSISKVLSNGTSDLATSGFRVRNLFCNNCNANYPVGYSGQLLREGFTPEPPAPTYFDIPNIVALAGVDYKVNFQDKNYNTFDYVEGSCNDDLTPVISWIIRDSDNEVVDSGYNSPTIQWEVQHPVIDESRNYTITGKYYCGDLESDPVFTDENVVEYSVDKNGLLNNKLIEDCFQDTFPFIDMGACIGNLKNALAFMSFNRFSFGTNLENAIPDNCHNLGTIGDWINAEGSNRIVCRRVPVVVREIVTPFVTLALGLVSLQFVASRGGGGF